MSNYAISLAFTYYDSTDYIFTEQNQSAFTCAYLHYFLKRHHDAKANFSVSMAVDTGCLIRGQSNLETPYQVLALHTFSLTMQQY